MVRKHLYISDEHERALKARAREIGVSETELVRRMLDGLLLDGEGEGLPGQALRRLHKLTTDLTRENDCICVEDLNTKGLAKTKLSRSVLDTAFGEFVRQVEYKAAWSFKRSIKVGRFFPSTKLCSGCGALNPNLTLVDRTWLCSSCGTQHDRDLNAARNILAEGMRVLAAGQTESQNARGEPVSLPTGSTAR
jgi:transposase